MKTYHAKQGEVIARWYLINLDDMVLGRAATKIAEILRGKNSPQFTRHVDTGDFVIAINARNIKLSGKKIMKKEYHRHTGYPGGLKTVKAEKLISSKPEQLIQEAVRGMLPKSILGRNQLKKLKIYAGAEHPHVAQQPVELKV